MNVQKHVLTQLNNAYAVASMELDGYLHFLVGTQARGKCFLFSPPDWTASEIWNEPGGSMSIVPIKGRPGAFVAIQKFYPAFQSEGAGLVYAERGENLKEHWNITRVMDLPFVHRFEIVELKNKPYVVAATLCGGKAFREDWSKPGAVYVGPIPDNPREQQWSLEPVLKGISKNHGMHVTTMDGREVVLISGQEGVFKIHIPENPGETWRHECIIDHEVSDIFVSDIDGDGIGEIITIEPFHGDNLAVYKLQNGQWRSVSRMPINYGHSIWGGKLRGETCVLVGCRAGARELSLLRPGSFNPLTMERTVLDQGVGTANLIVVHEKDRDLIFAANIDAEEVALYEITA